MRNVGLACAAALVLATSMVGGSNAVMVRAQGAAAPAAPAGAAADLRRFTQQGVNRQHGTRFDPPLQTRAVGGTWNLMGGHLADEPDYGSTPPADWGAASGRITGIAVNPANAANLWVATADGGVWGTTDGGTTWATHTDNQATLAIGAIAVDASGLLVFAGTGEANIGGDALPGQGILRSSNGGQSWTLVAPALAGQHVASITADRTTKGTSTHVFAATDAGLFVSVDGGFTWARNTQIDAVVHGGGAAKEYWQVTQDVTQANRFWAVAGNGCAVSGAQSGDILTSVDSGVTWTNDLDTSAKFGVQAGRIALGVGSAGHMYAMMGNCAGNSTYILVRTAYGGWKSGAQPPAVLGSQGNYNIAVGVDPTNANHVVFAGTYLYDSTKGALGTAAYKDIGHIYQAPGKIHPDLHAVVFTGAGSFYLASDGGIYHTSNLGKAWTNLNKGLDTLQFYRGSAVDTTHYLGGTQDNGAAGYFGTGTLPGLNEYTQVGDGIDAAVDPTLKSTTIYATGPSQQLAVGSATTLAANIPAGPCNRWVTPAVGIGCGDSTGFVSPFVIDPTNPKRIILATSSVYESDTGGVPTGAAGWRSISGPVVSAACSVADYVSSLLTGPAGQTNTMITDSNCGAVFMTTDGGRNPWQNVTGNLPQFDATKNVNLWSWGSAAAVNPWNHREAWATIRAASGVGHVWHTVDATSGNTWVDISANLPSEPVNSVLVDPRNPGTIYIGTAAGAYICTTCGGPGAAPSWSSLGGGLPNVWVNELTFTHDMSTVVAWTHGRGVWSLATPDANVQLQSFPAGNGAYTISPGPDGLWWPAPDDNQVRVLTRDWNKGTEGVMTLSNSNVEPFAMSATPYGLEWVTEFGSSALGQVASSLSTTVTDLSTPISSPDGICMGPDGNMYVSTYQTSHVDALDHTGHAVGSYALTSAARGCVTGPDGSVWVAEPNQAKVAKVVPGVNGNPGTLTEYVVPGGHGEEQMAVGPDGNVWFSDPGAGSIGRISVSSNPPVITEFAVGSSPIGITGGPNGDLFVALNGADAIARVSASTGAVIKVYALGGTGIGAYGVTLGPDGAIWVTEQTGALVKRFNIALE